MIPSIMCVELLGPTTRPRFQTRTLDLPRFKTRFPPLNVAANPLRKVASERLAFATSSFLYLVIKCDLINLTVCLLERGDKRRHVGRDKFKRT